MKFTITLHPVSLLVGAAALGGVLSLVSAVQAPASTGAATARAVSQVPLTITNAIEVKGVPVPENMVQIKEGTPYVVPAGRMFVVTALGSSYGAAQQGWLNVNGQTELLVNLNGNIPSGNIIAVPTGLSIPGGATISVHGTGQLGRAWGYLAAQ